MSTRDPSPAGRLPGATPGTGRTARLLAAAVCALEAVALAGFGVFYLLQLGSTGSDLVARVVTEAAVILLFAVGLGALARLWLGRSSWPATPTVVWHVLLVPVAWAMGQSGQWLIALALGVAVVLAIGATVSARGSELY